MTTMNELNEWKRAQLAPLSEIQDDRMKRYYDCQDDTIFGGASWNVTSTKMSSINEFYNLMEQQILNGYVKYEFVQSRLFDLNGNRIDAKIVQTKYGQSWVTSDGIFIGCAKKLSTIEKKGYTVKTFNVTLHCQFSGNKRIDKQCIYGTRPIFTAIEEFLTEIEFDGNHYTGLTWIK